MTLAEQFNAKLDDIGHFGSFQKKTFILLAISTMPTGWHAYSQILLSKVPEFACGEVQRRSNFNFNYTFDEYYGMTVPYETLLGKQEPKECYTFDYGQDIYNSTEEVLKIGTVDKIKCPNPPEGNYVYNTSDITLTATTRWHTVCKDKYLQTLDTQSFMVGKLVGAFIFSGISDAIGRFKTYFVAIILQAVFGIMVAISPNFYLYTFSRLAVGATCSGVYLCAYVLALEFMGQNKRTTPGLAYHMFYAVGYSLLSPIGYFVKDYRTVSWILALPSLIFLSYYFLIDESVQWLLVKNRTKEAEAIVLKAAKTNGVELQSPVFIEDEVKKNTEIDETKSNACTPFISMFHEIGNVATGNFPKLKVRFVAIFVMWFINSGSYYGLTLNTKNLGGNFYLNTLITALVEIPAISLIIFCVAKWDVGRRKILIYSYLFCGALNLLVALIQTDWIITSDTSPGDQLIVTLAMMGKFCISGAYAVIYLFSTEQFPTVIKNSGLGMCSLFARFGGLLCPYVVELQTVWLPLPLLVFGVVSVIAAGLTTILPETHKKILPTTLEDAEKFGLNSTNLEEGLPLNK